MKVCFALYICFGICMFEPKLMIDSVPPVSVFYPPNSHPSLLNLVPKSLPPKSLAVRVFR